VDDLHTIKISITDSAGFTHTSETGSMLYDVVEQFELLLRAAGFVFDGKLGFVDDDEEQKIETV
jgi:hypothetical protein